MTHEDEIDVDAATVEVIRANDAEIERLAAELAQGGSDERQLQLARELVNAAKRQEAVLIETPGMEQKALAIAKVREGIAAHYGLE